MIAAAALIVGLLLALTGLGAARIPGEATFASSGNPFAGQGRVGAWIRAFVLSPVHPASWNATGAIVGGLFVGVIGFTLVVSLFSAGAASLFAGIGIVLVAFAIEGSRIVARIERKRAQVADPRPLIAHPYKPVTGSLVDLVKAEFADENRWRDVLYVGVNLPLVVVEFAVVAGLWVAALGLLTAPTWYDVAGGLAFESRWFALAPGTIAWLAVPVGLILLPVAASAAQLVMTLHRAVVEGLLCTSETRALRRQVETLRESRSAVLDVEAGELRRIERDLHDGAQQRLVMMTLDLGLAAEKIDTDPEAAKRLVLEGREQARLALAEIRNLVRGIAPAILLDRGLEAAIGSISGRGAVATTVHSELAAAERFPDPIERAAYFVVAESLANVAKHSGATRCEVRLRREGDALVVEVWDDGVGGATQGPTGGLAGLAGRVAGVDGTFAVNSPPGGPTTVRAAFPLPAPRYEPR